MRDATSRRHQPRRLLTLDVHDEIDPTTREWVTVDETGHAFMDADEARAEALGGGVRDVAEWPGISTPISFACCNSSRSRSRRNAAELTMFESWRFDAPPLSMNGGFERARAVFGGEAELERILSGMNRAVFGIASGRPRPSGDAPDPTNP